MAKTAYLYTFHATTRVVADPSEFENEDKFFEYLSKKAREQMIANGIDKYLYGDNGEYEEDLEVPYNEG